MSSILGAPWFYWAVGVAVGFPVCLVMLTELHNALLRRGSALARPVHLVVSEVVMPDMSGPELARRLARGWPETRVLFVSGQTTDDSAPDVVLAQDAAFLQKPFSPDALARKVRDAMASRP